MARARDASAPGERSLAEQVASAPRTPGCYTFWDASGTALYIGKAIDVRARLRQHLADPTPRRRKMLGEAVTIDWIVCASEAEALVVEARRVREFDPRYNVRLREADPYPYLGVIDSRLGPARVQPLRGPTRGGTLRYGPWPQRGVLDALLSVAQEVYGLRSCSDGTFLRARAQRRACLLHELGRCAAPCIELIDSDEHARRVEQLGKLARGDTAAARADVHARMADAAGQRRYERAARLRDLAATLGRVEDAWRAQGLDGLDVDAIGLSAPGALRAVTRVEVRNGAVVAVRSLVDEAGRTDVELVAAVLAEPGDGKAREVLVPVPAASLAGVSGVRLVAPRAPARKALVSWASENAAATAERASRTRDADPHKRAGALAALGAACGIDAPFRIEAFDISHTAGRQSRAAMVVLEDALPVRREYRAYKVPEGGDDYLAIAHAVRTRYRRVADGVGPRPDLVLIDGGPGQLAAARAALAELGLLGDDGLVTVALAKRDEELWLDSDTMVRLERHDPALHVVQRARDEAHRHSRAQHRRAREHSALAHDGLPVVPGLGPARRRQVLNALNGVELANADVDVLAGVGLPRAVAGRLAAALAERREQASDATGDAEGVDTETPGSDALGTDALRTDALDA